MKTTRRQFLHTSVLSVVGLSLTRSLALAAGSAGAIPIGLQLFAVRGAFAKSVPDTLKSISQIGYKGVEFWGYKGTPTVYQQYTAAQLRKMLDDLGLKCCGIHLALEALSGDNLKQTIENNLVLGNIYLNLAAAKEKMGSEKSVAELAAILNKAAEQCRPQNMQVGYHAHPFDFVQLNGKYAWEILFSQLRPEVNMQLDTGNTLAGKGDPLAMLKKFPGRTKTFHIREYEDKTFDSDYFKQMFQLCETVEKTKWYIVEMGDPKGDNFDVPRDALAKLHKLGK